MKLRILFISLFFNVLLTLTGCASTNSRVAAPEEAFDDYPVWVLESDNYFIAPAGVHCMDNSAEMSEYEWKKNAESKARLKLIRNIGGRQQIYSDETLRQNNGNGVYNATIRMKSFGKIGRNHVAEDAFLTTPNGQVYCVAVVLDEY